MENNPENSSYATNWSESEIREKPELQPVSSPPNWGKTVFTMLLFVLIFKLIGVDILVILALLVVVTIHEMGHFVAMRAFGYINVSMFFVPLLGAFVSGEKRETPPGAEIIMLLAGPIPGILIGLGLLFWHPGMEVIALGFMFLLLNLFNMLPFLPLDGGRIMDSIFARENLVVRIVLLGISIVALLGFMIMLKSFWLAILGIGILRNITDTVQMIKTRKQMRHLGLNYQQSYGQLSNEEYSKFVEFVEDEFEEFETEQQKAHQVAALLSRTSPRHLTLGESIGYFTLWLVFLVGPIFAMELLPIEELTQFLSQ